jgi:hypothetical protein
MPQATVCICLIPLPFAILLFAMVPWGRILIILGLILLAAGLLLEYTHLFSWFHLGRLPGDIKIKRGSYSFYFPVATCIILSLILTLILYIFRK